MALMATTVPFCVVPQVGQFAGELQALVKAAQEKIPRASRIFDFMIGPGSEAELDALEDDDECLRRSAANSRLVLHAIHVDVAAVPDRGRQVPVDAPGDLVDRAFVDPRQTELVAICLGRQIGIPPLHLPSSEATSEERRIGSRGSVLRTFLTRQEVGGVDVVAPGANLPEPRVTVEEVVAVLVQ